MGSILRENYRIIEYRELFEQFRLYFVCIDRHTVQYRRTACNNLSSSFYTFLPSISCWRMAQAMAEIDEEQIRLDGARGLERFARNADFMSADEASNLQLFREYGAEEFAEAAASGAAEDALAGYLGALLSSLGNITDNAVARYLLLLLDAATEALRHTPAFRLRGAAALDVLPRLLRDESDVFCVARAAAVLARFASAGLASEELLAMYLGWIQQKLGQGGAPAEVTHAALSSLMVCLNRVENREKFVVAGGVAL